MLLVFEDCVRCIRLEEQELHYKFNVDQFTIWKELKDENLRHASCKGKIQDVYKREKGRQYLQRAQKLPQHSSIPLDQLRILILWKYSRKWFRGRNIIVLTIIRNQPNHLNKRKTIQEVKRLLTIFRDCRLPSRLSLPLPCAFEAAGLLFLPPKTSASSSTMSSFSSFVPLSSTLSSSPSVSSNKITQAKKLLTLGQKQHQEISFVC